MEPEILLPFSQGNTIGTYSEPNEYSLIPTSYLLTMHFNIIRVSLSRSYEWSLPFRL
jgi:hypothetical protein